MKSFLVFFLISLCFSIEVFRNRTQHIHITISKFGKRIGLCKQEHCESHKRNGFQYVYERNSQPHEIYYNNRNEFELCCEPKFSQDEDYVYFIKRQNSELSLIKKPMQEDCCDTYVSNISQNYPHFSVNHDSLILLSSEDDRMKIFHQEILKHTVQPYNPILDDQEVYFELASIKNLDVSEDGEIIAVNANKIYFYSAQDRQTKGYENQFTDSNNQYHKRFAWLSESSVLVNINKISSHFFHKHILSEQNSSYYYDKEFFIEGTEYLHITGSGNGEYICTVQKYSFSLNFIGVYRYDQFQDSLYSTRMESSPDLVILEPGVILSIELNEDGSILTYIMHGEDYDQEYVVVFHTLGEQEVVYPCHTEFYRNKFSELCSSSSTTVPEIDGLQIFVYAISMLMFVFLLVVIICLCVRYKQVKRQIEKEKMRQKQMELDKMKESEDGKNIRVFEKMPYNSEAEIRAANI